FFFGQFGLADISLATHFLAASYVDHGVDSSRWPHLAAYLKLLFDHPVVSKQMAIDKSVIAKLM
ncbi:MAG: hypothetical protein OQK12_15060, partial [Motiliproteus sp.]|nr:hypothetical protein [Motiliproteus sp.]